MLRERPRWWPKFSSTLRSTAVTARLGRVLGLAIGVLFVTGLLSHYQYEPWAWLPAPASPVWGYRLTQGVHVATGTATIPLLLLKLWSVYPNLFRFPPVRSLLHALERASLAVLVSSALVQVATGFLNVLNWYPFPWYFVTVHRFLGYVLVGSVLLHVGIKLPDIAYGLKARLAEADVLTEVPWDENPDSHSNAGTLAPPRTPGISRRGVLTAAGAGIGVVVVTSVGQTLTPLEPLGLLAPRQWTRGPQQVPVNRTAEQARVAGAATAAGWTLEVTGPRPTGSPWRTSRPARCSRRGYPSTASRDGASARTGAGCRCSRSCRRPAAQPTRASSWCRSRPRAASTTPSSRARSSRPPSWRPTSTGSDWTSTTATRSG